MKQGCWIVNTDYGSFLTDTKDFIGYKIHKEYVWEPEIIKTYQSLIKPHYITVDIGAHMGFHTVNLAHYSKHVYAFEPQLPLYNQLCGNVFLNGLDNRITCFNVGLGEKDKRSSFGDLYKHNSLNWKGNEGIEVINYGGRSLEDHLGIDDIIIGTLDSYYLAPHFIKMDVEGYELKTLQGAVQTLEQHHPILLFESFTNYQQGIFSLLETIGYEILSIPNTEQEADFIAIHPEFEDYLSAKESIISKN
jgi:FkbM family methyltransferase